MHQIPGTQASCLVVEPEAEIAVGWELQTVAVAAADVVVVAGERPDPEKAAEDPWRCR